MASSGPMTPSKLRKLVVLGGQIADLRPRGAPWPAQTIENGPEPLAGTEFSGDRSSSIARTADPKNADGHEEFGTCGGCVACHHKSCSAVDSSISQRCWIKNCRPRWHGKHDTIRGSITGPVGSESGVRREYLGSGRKLSFLPNSTCVRRERARPTGPAGSTSSCRAGGRSRSLEDLSRDCRVLVSAVFLAAGYHSRNGEWRRRRVYRNRRTCD